MKKYILISLFFVILLTLVVPVTTQAISYNELNEWITGRAEFVNKNQVVFDNSLNNDQVMSNQQLNNRVTWLLQYSNKYNYMYPDIDYRVVILNMLAIIEVETNFVNYAELDNGDSFGVMSMQWDTFEFVANMLGEDFDKENRWDRYEVIQDVERQMRYGIYYYYYILQRNDGDRYLAAIKYNRGHNFDKNENSKMFRNYTFNVKGRVNYFYNQLNFNSR